MKKNNLFLLPFFFITLFSCGGETTGSEDSNVKEIKKDYSACECYNEKMRLTEQQGKASTEEEKDAVFDQQVALQKSCEKYTKEDYYDCNTQTIIFDTVNLGTTN